MAPPNNSDATAPPRRTLIDSDRSDSIRPNITQTTHPETENTISYTYNIHVLNVPDLLYSSRYRVVERNYVCARSCSSFSCCVVLFVVSCGITPLIPNHACITVKAVVPELLGSSQIISLATVGYNYLCIPIACVVVLCFVLHAD